MSVVNPDGSISVTNVTVFLFTGITAFRSLFSGVVINFGAFDWKIEALDLSSTLPLLFGLINYGHRRMIQNQTETKEVKNEE